MNQGILSPSNPTQIKRRAIREGKQTQFVHLMLAPLILASGLATVSSRK